MATATANSKKLDATDHPGRSSYVMRQLEQLAGGIGYEKDREGFAV